VIVELSDKILKAYDRRGKSIWKYDVTDSSELIGLWSMSRSGNYVVAFRYILKYEYIEGFLTLLKYGLVEWEVPILKKGVPIYIKITSNNKYIVFLQWDPDGYQSTIYLYSMDGELLWLLSVKGFPLGLDVADDGLVSIFLNPESGSKRREIIAIRDGKIVWKRMCIDVRDVRMTPDGSRIVIQYPKGIHVLREFEETIWKYEREK